MKEIYKVLDKGYIKYLEKCGDEITIVNCARVSFGNEEKISMEECDKKLIKYLIKHNHTSPFRHVFLRFHIKAPEFVLRQWFKHVVGIEWSTNSANQLHGWNEISGRYVLMKEFYIPEIWRKQSINKKQGSEGYIERQKEAKEKYIELLCEIENTYNELIEYGVAKEQARIVLPLCIYTECIWTVSLQAIINFIRLRDAEDAQYEIREYARILSLIIEREFPNCFEAFKEENYKNMSK